MIRRFSHSLILSLSQAEIDAGTREGTPELLAAIANFTYVYMSERTESIQSTATSSNTKFIGRVSTLVFCHVFEGTRRARDAILIRYFTPSLVLSAHFLNIIHLLTLLSA